MRETAEKNKQGAAARDPVGSLDSLESYLELCGRACRGLDLARLRDLAAAAERHYSGRSGASESETSPFRELEQRWYASLDRGEPDYSVYGGELFLAEAWACWRLYSRKYTRALALRGAVRGPRGRWRRGVDVLGNAHSIVDLGCGCGHAAAALRHLWPEAEVVGTNLRGTLQFAVARAMGREHNFSVRAAATKHADLVFASEYFEHVERPVDHLVEILKKTDPEYLVVANSFSAVSVGHFRTYLGPAGEPVPCKKMARLFNLTLQERGYRRLETKFWNDRPAVWARA